MAIANRISLRSAQKNYLVFSMACCLLLSSFGIVGNQSNQHLIVKNCDFMEVSTFMEVNDKELIRWTFPDGIASYGKLARHCFEKDGQNEVLLEWMSFDDPDKIIGSKRILLEVQAPKHAKRISALVK